MITPDLTGLTATYRRPASGRTLAIPVVAVAAGAGVLGLSARATTSVQVMAWIVYACLAVVVGITARRFQPATRFTREGVQRRRFTSGWHLIKWDDVVGVEAPPHPSSDPVLHLRGGERVDLYGVVPATAEALAARFAERD